MTVDELIEKIKKSTQHKYLYHFTDEANFPSISAKGLLSKERMRAEGWWPPLATGGNALSHDLDTYRGIDPYVSLCLTRSHRMKFLAQKDGRLPNPRYLGIHPEVLKIEGVRIAFGVANANGVEILPANEAVKKLDAEVLYDRTNWSDPAVQQRLQAAEKLEVLVPNCVPIELIAGVFLMATRPVFFPSSDEAHLVHERSFEFPWASGFAEVQKKKNIDALHSAARQKGVEKILEISSKSSEELGRKLSAFSLKIDIDGRKFPLESVYQGSKVFEKGGPFPEIFDLSPREAKRFIREADFGKLVKFELEGQTFPLSPMNAFYDWLYIRSLADHAEWISRNVHYEAFTDIEFNPAKQVNCQARAFAEYLTLLKKGKLSEVANDFSVFAKMIRAI